MDYLNFHTRVERSHLVERANHLIEKYNFQVPRFFSLSFLNYEFWSILFTRIFGIKCNASLGTQSERVEMINSCVNTLVLLVDENLDHIQADQLLHYDFTTMGNLMEVAEKWENPPQQCNMDEDYSLDDNDVHVENYVNDDYGNDVHVTQGGKMAEQLCQALRNQALAIEIEKKVKIYLGDVTVQHMNDFNCRSSRQSIVRTRATNPTSTFDFSMHQLPKQNQALSVELARLFPELADDFLQRLEQEKSLLMSKNNVKLWQENLAMNQINRALTDIVSQQKQRIIIAEKNVKEKCAVEKAKNERAQRLAMKSSQRDIRTQRALLKREIDTFHRESTAAYKNARSHLERILVLEFRKVNK